MISLAFGLLIAVLIIALVLMLVKRYSFSKDAERWRNSIGFARGMAAFYDWCDGRDLMHAAKQATSNKQ